MTIRITTDLSDRIVAVAESWNDLSRSDLLACYAILMSDAPAFIEPSEVMWAKRLELFMYLTHTTEADIKQWRAACMEEHGEEDGHYVFIEEIDEVLSHFNHLIEEVETDEAEGETRNRMYQVKLGLTKCPVTIIKNSEVGFEWHAPADGLSNLTIYELGQVFMLIENYLETHDEQIVNDLIATVYRPAKPATVSNINSDYEGDIRLPYNRHEKTVARRAPYVAHLPELTKQIILFWLASCRQDIISGWPNLFNADDQPEGERVGNDYRWAGIIMSLANDVTQIDTIAEKAWENVFVYLSFLEDKRKMEEMRMKQQRPVHS